MATNIASVSELTSGARTEPVAVAKSKSLRIKRCGTYDADLEWFLGCGDSALGARGTLAGVIAALERGGANAGTNLDEAGCYSHPYRDDQLGIGPHTTGAVEKHRWLSSAWRLCSPKTHLVLCKRYSAPLASLRADEGFGANDRYVEGSDGKSGQHGMHQGRASGILGELAALCFAMYPDPAKLAVACNEPAPTQMRKGVIVTNLSKAAERTKVRKEALALARNADAEAHAEWFEAKTRANPIRATRERRKVLPAHVPGDAVE